MSWEKSIDGASIGAYYSNKIGTSNTPTSAIGAFIIDTLEDKLSTIKDRIGRTPIKYFWFHANEPSKELYSPAVGISVSTTERPTVGTHLSSSDGVMIPGSLMVAELVLVVIADSPRMREEISNKMFKVLNKKIYHESIVPLFYITKATVGDDMGFSAIDRFVMSSLWQNVTEDKYLKIDKYKIGYAENYIDIEDDPEDVAWGVVGGVRGISDVDGIVTQYDPTSSSISIRFSLVPTNT